MCVCACTRVHKYWGRGALIQLMSTFPVFILFRCSVASIGLLHAALFMQFGITNLGVAVDGEHVYPLYLSFVFMPETQSGIALGWGWKEKERKRETEGRESVCYHLQAP